MAFEFPPLRVRSTKSLLRIAEGIDDRAKAAGSDFDRPEMYRGAAIDRVLKRRGVIRPIAY